MAQQMVFVVVNEPLLVIKQGYKSSNLKKILDALLIIIFPGEDASFIGISSH